MAATKMSAACVTSRDRRLAVADRHRGRRVQQHHRRRLADNVGPSDDDGVLPSDRQLAAPQNLDDARWCAGRESRLAALQPSHIHRMEAVDVLVRRDRLEQPLGIDVLRQGQLDQDAVDVVARVQLGDQRQHLVSRNALGRRQHLAEDTQFPAGLYLAANVDLRCRHLADENDRETRNDAARRQSLHLGCDLGLNLTSNCNAI